MDAQTRQCPQCKGTVSQNAQECPLCGIIFKRYEEARDTLNKDAISAYENGDLPHSRKLFERLIQSFPDLTDLAQSYLKSIEDQEKGGIMASFFKKKATATEIATAFLQFPKDLSGILDNLPSGTDLKCVEDEFKYLLVFVLNYATSITLGDTPETKAILDVYYSHLKSTLDPDVYNNLCAHLDVYTDAVNTPHQNGPAWTVGVAFSKFCGFELDIEMTMTGSMFFVEFFEQASKFLKSYRITV